MTARRDDTNNEPEVAAELVRRTGSGERSAEGEIIERYGNGVRLMLLHLCHDPDLAADLFQDTFRIVIERLRDRGIDEPRKLAAFIRQTGRNLLIADSRTRARRKTYSDSDAVEASMDKNAGPFRQVAIDEDARMVSTLISSLPTPRDRQILTRFYLAEEDKDKICADLGLDSLHFNRVIHRARRRFRELLEQQAAGQAAP